METGNIERNILEMITKRYLEEYLGVNGVNTLIIALMGEIHEKWYTGCSLNLWLELVMEHQVTEKFTNNCSSKLWIGLIN